MVHVGDSIFEYDYINTESNKRFVCKHKDDDTGLCNKMYGAKCHMVRHMKERHTNIRYKCKYCGELYRQNSSLKKHLKNKHK